MYRRMAGILDSCVAIPHFFVRIHTNGAPNILPYLTGEVRPYLAGGRLAGAPMFYNDRESTNCGQDNNFLKV